jgi:tetratricopeptide (TPR) repeat protein
VAEWHYRLGKLMWGHGNKAAALPELEQALNLGDKPNELIRPWVFDAHYLLADGLRPTPANKAKAIEHYKRFLELAPKDNAYVPDAKAALLGLGVRESG